MIVTSEIQEATLLVIIIIKSQQQGVRVQACRVSLGLFSNSLAPTW